jgi:hypothetical protein
MELIPTPESTFISSAREELGQPPTPTNSIRQDELANRLIAMQQQHNKFMEEKKLEILEAKLANKLKKAEDAATKRIEQEKKKAEEAATRSV